MDLKLHHPCGNQILKIIALQVAGWSLLLVQACSHLLNHGLAGLYAHTSLTLQVLRAADAHHFQSMINCPSAVLTFCSSPLILDGSTSKMCDDDDNDVVFMVVM